MAEGVFCKPLFPAQWFALVVVNVSVPEAPLRHWRSISVSLALIAPDSSRLVNEPSAFSLFLFGLNHERGKTAKQPNKQTGAAWRANSG